jgi:peptidoglycan/LPS O-acetylase OafA/YrhL
MNLPSPRIPAIDALRVMAVLLLVIFHAGLVFTGFHHFVVEDSVKDRLIEVAAVSFLHLWHMPLFFMLAGMAAWSALGRRSAGQFLSERVRRLLVPFIAGCLILIPPQVYLDGLSRGWFKGSYLEFLRLYFTIGLSSGIFSWHHLWFILYLFVLSLILLPALIGLRSNIGQRLIDNLANLARWRGGLIVLIAPALITEITLRARWPGFLYNLYADLANLALFGIFLLLGAVVMADERFIQAIDRDWPILLAAALPLTVYLLWPIAITGQRPIFSTTDPGYPPYVSAFALNAWCWALAWIGAGRRLWPLMTPHLQWLSERSYAFYILHQTVLVILAYYVIQTDWLVGIKFALIALGTLIITGLAVELLRRVPVIREVVLGI